MKTTVIDKLCQDINSIQGKTRLDSGFLQYANIVGDGRNWRTVYATTNPQGGLTAIFNRRSPKETARVLRAVRDDLIK